MRSCPVNAITMTKDGPIVDRKVCVECLCCHEVCPHQAVRIKLSWLAGKFA
jgi:Fe-S-cluster-containing hydrogenase component 2